MADVLCRCGSGLDYLQCCAPFHHGAALPPTALALMRSRFTAYCLRNASYLLETWAAHTRPIAISFANDHQQWQKLAIIRTKAGGISDSNGIVEFTAHYIEDGQSLCMNERSRFVKTGGRWFYLDGVVSCLPETGKQTGPSKNARCSCGSGKKFKRCCGVGEA
jgi:SEC-C motif-containing protein